MTTYSIKKRMIRHQQIPHIIYPPPPAKKSTQKQHLSCKNSWFGRFNQTFLLGKVLSIFRGTQLRGNFRPQVLPMASRTSLPWWEIPQRPRSLYSSPPPKLLETHGFRSCHPVMSVGKPESQKNTWQQEKVGGTYFDWVVVSNIFYFHPYLGR